MQFIWWCYLEAADVEDATIDSICQRASASETPQDECRHSWHCDEQKQDADHKRRLVTLTAKALFIFHIRTRLLCPFACATQRPHRRGSAEIDCTRVDRGLAFIARVIVMFAAAAVSLVIARVPERDTMIFRSFDELPDSINYPWQLYQLSTIVSRF